MPRRNNNYGLDPSTTRDCPHCKSNLHVSQQWAEGEAKEPPSCPVCDKAFLTRDVGVRKDLNTGKEYRQNYVVEYTRVTVIRRGPETPESNNSSDDVR
jgi:transposase-like protein